MGSSQSTPAAVQTEAVSVKSEKTNPKDLKGIHLAEYKCRRKKTHYNRCYHNAYKRFIDAQAAQAGHECADEFDDYRTCVLRHMKKQLVEKGNVTIHPESMLGELAEDD